MARNFKQGKFVPKNPEKYKGNVKNIVFRSSWEFEMFKYCDKNKKIKFWSSEEISEEMIIPYISPKDGKIHRYFMDLKIVDSNDNTTLIEIKPFSQTRPPKVPTRQTKKYLLECLTYAVNEAKWKAAHKHCKERGWKFLIMTEKQIFKDK